MEPGRKLFKLYIPDGFCYVCRGQLQVVAIGKWKQIGEKANISHPFTELKPALSLSAQYPCIILSLYVLHEFCHECSQIASLTVNKCLSSSFHNSSATLTSVLHIHHRGSSASIVSVSMLPAQPSLLKADKKRLLKESLTLSV